MAKAEARSSRTPRTAHASALGSQVGWLVLGDEGTFCMDCAPDVAAITTLYDGIAQPGVQPISSGAGTFCSECGRELAAT